MRSRGGLWRCESRENLVREIGTVIYPEIMNLEYASFIFDNFKFISLSTFERL